MMEVVTTTGAIRHTFKMSLPTPSVFLQARCPSSRPINSVKALNGIGTVTRMGQWKFEWCRKSPS